MYYSKNDDKIPLGVVTCILEILTLTAIATFVKFLSPNVSIAVSYTHLTLPTKA